MTKVNIALIGMMGTFKSSAGLLLSKRLGLRFADVDGMIESAEKMSVADIFARHGAEYFRDRESEQIAAAAKLSGAVIACGGGAVLRGQNVEALRESCVIVRLHANAHAIFGRVSGSAVRPLLAGSDMTEQHIADLMRQREQAYSAAADVTVDNSCLSSEQTAREIERLVRQLSGTKKLNLPN